MLFSFCGSKKFRIFLKKLPAQSASWSHTHESLMQDPSAHWNPLQGQLVPSSSSPSNNKINRVKIRSYLYDLESISLFIII